MLSGAASRIFFFNGKQPTDSLEFLSEVFSLVVASFLVLKDILETR